jgi:hypothetical protein
MRILMNNVVDKKFTKLNNTYLSADLSVNEIVRGDQNVYCAPDDYSTKTSKNILNIFNHLP